MSSADYTDLLAEYEGLGGHEERRDRKKKKRDPLFLEALVGSGSEFDPLVFDIESKAGPGSAPGFVRPFVIGLWDGKEFLTFRNDPIVADMYWRTRHYAPGGCIDRFMITLMRLYPGRKIYAHNGGGFDMLFLLAWLRRHPEFSFDLVPVQSSILRLDVWPTGSENPKKDAVTFLDSMKLLPGSLDRACKAFGVEGKSTKTESEKNALMNLPEDRPEWETYLRQDCVCLRDVLLKFHELISKLGGEVATTTPATAMKLFRMKFLGAGNVTRIERHRHFKNCKQKSCLGCLHDWIRVGYKGGRVEIFTMAGSDIHYYDFNSSYPAVLKEPMPVGGKIEQVGQPDWSLRDRYVGFVECEVFIPPSCNVPPLPLEKDGKLIFPTGRFSGTWDVAELELLADPMVNGHIRSVGRTVWYKAEKVFAPMIDKLYRMRPRLLANGEKCTACSKDIDSCEVCGFELGVSELAKLLMNAFYGKFGMDPNRESIVVYDGSLDKDGKKKVLPQGAKPAWHAGDPDSAITSDVYYAPTFSDADYIIPQIASHVTALARRRLWEEMVRMSKASVTRKACALVDEMKTSDGIEKFLVTRRVEIKLVTVHETSEVKKLGDQGSLVVFHVWRKKDKKNWGDGVVQDNVITRTLGVGACIGETEDGIIVELSFELAKTLVHPTSAVKAVGDTGELVTWGQLYYADTDSILTDSTIESSNKLGEMKDELGGDMVDFEAVQPKGYVTRKHSTGESTIKFKGLPGRERTLANFRKMVNHESVSYRRLGKVRTLAAQDFWPAPSMVKVEKSVKSQYDKRILMSDGSTMPIVFDGDRIVAASRFDGYAPP